MKKLGIILIFFAVLLSGCQSSNNQDKPNVDKHETLTNKVVEMHGAIENIEGLNHFVQNVQNHQSAEIQLVRYTIEGDPIYHKLHFTGERIEYTIDNTKDKFGDGKILYYECISMNKKETNKETSYLLEGCSNSQIEDFLTIYHDVNQTDYFAFDLKYNKNEINTKDQELVLDSKDGEITTVSDFQFSTEEMNKIYKLMVLSNYLEEKQLSNKCTEKQPVSYELTVWINSAERHFKWADCDNSMDGKEMTKLAKDILNVLKDNKTYQAAMKES